MLRMDFGLPCLSGLSTEAIDFLLDELIMEIHVYDTYVKAADGHVMHFDVFTAEKDDQKAIQYAKQWLDSIGGGNSLVQLAGWSTSSIIVFLVKPSTNCLARLLNSASIPPVTRPAQP